MIKLQCDLCRKDKDRIAFNLKISNLDLDYETSQTKVCHEKTFLLCQECFGKLQLPNIYSKGE